jgi:O-antigen ligase
LTAALALFSLVAYAGIIHTEEYADGFRVANKFVSLPAIYFLVSVLLQSDRSEETAPRRAESLLLAFLAGLAALDLLGALTYLGVVGDAAFALPLTPLGMHHIWFSNLNALGLYTAAALLLFSRRGASVRGRTALGGFLLLSTLCILLSTSRTAWFGIALTAAIVAAVLVKRKRTVVLGMSLTALLAISVYWLVPFIHDRIDLISRDAALFATDKSVESSIGSRLLLWRASFLMFKSNPVVGVGTGDFVPALKNLRRTARRLVPRFILGYNQPHNMYLFSLATNGLVGVAALLYIFYRSLSSAVPILRSDGSGKLFAFLAMATATHFMISGFMDSFFNIQILRFSFAFIMGVCIRSSATPVLRS